jgi:ATP-dependent 26S proteasome regulatory subunit
MDGFERNQGLIVLATTNYPERIDSAIIDRPSRFDRKYHFALPPLVDRRVYLSDWQQRLEHDTGWSADEVAAIAVSTEGFSCDSGSIFRRHHSYPRQWHRSVGRTHLRAPYATATDPYIE